jgi:hypothetical protein
MFVGRNFGYYRYSALQDFWMMLSQQIYRGYSLFGGSGDDLKELQNLMLANLVFIFKIILKLLITLNFPV